MSLDGPPRQSVVGRGLDFATDALVVAYAAWTLTAYAGMLTDARVTVLFVVWVATLPLLVAGLLALRRRAGARLAADPEEPSDAGPQSRRRPSRRLVAAGVVAGLLSALVVLVGKGAPWPLVWVPALAAAAIAVASGRWSSAPVGAKRARRLAEDAFAAAVALGFAAMALFIRNPNSDDAFYVNRATAVAELDRIPIRDVLFTDEEVAATSGAGLPVDTFSVLQGAFGGVLGIDAPSVAYYATPPLMTFFATWALWRLVRAWAPRNDVLCFSLGCVYWLWSAQFSLNSGSFFLARMWQGKVIFVAFLIPVLYTYLTRWIAGRDALTAVLLVAAAVSGIGLTGSATFVVPLVFGTAALALIARRDWRGLPLVVAAAAIPFVVGLVAIQTTPLAEQFAQGLPEKWWHFGSAFGAGLVAAIGAAAAWTAPWLARSGPAARITSGIAIVAVVLLAPGVFVLLSQVAGVTDALRRTLWVIPLPALVGLLAAVPVARLLGKRAVAVPAVVVAGALVVSGQPLWATPDGVRFTVRPTWKTNQQALAEARAILDHYDGNGPILADIHVMGSIALLTVRPKAVNARTFYARLTPEPPERTRARLLLTRFIAGAARRPAREDVRLALRDLRVGLVCVERWRTGLVDEVEAAGRYAKSFETPRRICLRRQGS